MFIDYKTRYQTKNTRIYPENLAKNRRNHPHRQNLPQNDPDTRKVADPDRQGVVAKNYSGRQRRFRNDHCLVENFDKYFSWWQKFC